MFSSHQGQDEGVVNLRVWEEKEAANFLEGRGSVGKKVEKEQCENKWSGYGPY